MRFLTAFLLSVLALPVFIQAAQAHSRAEVTLDLPLHRGPGADYSIIGYIPKNREVEVIYCRHNWCKVLYHGYHGWVAPAYLAKTRRFYDYNYRGPIVRRKDDSYRVHAKIRHPWPHGVIWDRDFSVFYPRHGPWFPGYNFYFHKNF